MDVISPPKTPRPRKQQNRTTVIHALAETRTLLWPMHLCPDGKEKTKKKATKDPNRRDGSIRSIETATLETRARRHTNSTKRKWPRSLPRAGRAPHAARTRKDNAPTRERTRCNATNKQRQPEANRKEEAVTPSFRFLDSEALGTFRYNSSLRQAARACVSMLWQ